MHRQKRIRVPEIVHTGQGLRCNAIAGIETYCVMSMKLKLAS